VGALFFTVTGTIRGYLPLYRRPHFRPDSDLSAIAISQRQDVMNLTAQP
jgi:hypothetical protein